MNKNDYCTELSGHFGNPSCDYEVENGIIIKVIPDDTCKEPGIVIDEKDGIVGIGPNAFKKEDCVYGISLPDCIKYIADGAFAGCAFDCSYFPESLAYIGDNAFKDSYCFHNLYNVTDFPVGLKHIGKSAFANSSIGDVIIHKELTEIGKGAFRKCRDMEYITVDDDNPAYYSKNGILYDRKDDSVICKPY